ncbi:hypothetical protein EJ03DRAFT_326560 [Teratosphaeria nubilosa]|uniref:Uncharacterized protein n=1 Tax=Teratosphaeria nubilosa TaxID=161662 RepID=A0A6G1LC24_9PEZI|nr:hypothetical protein EJ03DRAFT_326560 [Teratosphaeria nubilosa]
MKSRSLQLLKRHNRRLKEENHTKEFSYATTMVQLGRGNPFPLAGENIRHFLIDLEPVPTVDTGRCISPNSKLRDRRIRSERVDTTDRPIMPWASNTTPHARSRP